MATMTVTPTSYCVQTRRTAPFLPPLKKTFSPPTHTPIIPPIETSIFHLSNTYTPNTDNLSAIMFRTQLARQVRLFSTSPIVRKSPVESVKDAAKTVDRTISDQVVKGIEKGGMYIPICYYLSSQMLDPSPSRPLRLMLNSRT
jgi:hypothetical protein